MSIKISNLSGEFCFYTPAVIFFMLLLFPRASVAENSRYVVNDIPACFADEYPGDHHFAPAQQKLFSNHGEANEWLLKIISRNSSHSGNSHIEAGVIPLGKDNWFYSFIKVKDLDEYYYGVWPKNPACVKPWTNTSIHVTLKSEDVIEAKVSLYTPDGAILGKELKTDKNGRAFLSLSGGGI